MATAPQLNLVDISILGEDYDKFIKDVDAHLAQDLIGPNEYTVQQILEGEPQIALKEGALLPDYDRYRELLYVDALKNDPAYLEQILEETGTTREDLDQLDDPELLEKFRARLRKYETEAAPVSQKPRRSITAYERGQRKKPLQERYRGPAAEKMAWGRDEPRISEEDSEKRRKLELATALRGEELSDEVIQNLFFNTDLIADTSRATDILNEEGISFSPNEDTVATVQDKLESLREKTTPTDLRGIKEQLAGLEGASETRLKIQRGGGDPDRYYFDDVPFADRWARQDKTFWGDYVFGDEDPLELSPLSAPLIKRLVSPYELSTDEAENILRAKLDDSQMDNLIRKGVLTEEDKQSFEVKDSGEVYPEGHPKAGEPKIWYIAGFDPDAIAKYADVPNREDVMVRSDRTEQKWLPFDPLDSPSAGGEQSFERGVDTLLSVIGVEGPLLVAEGGGMLGWTRILRKWAERHYKKVAAREGVEKAADILGTGKPWYKHAGKVAGETLGYASIAGISAASARFYALERGIEAGIQPDLTFDRAMEDAGLLGIYAFLGAGAGELLMRSAMYGWNAVTGKRIPQHLVDRIKIRAKDLKDRFKNPNPEQDLDFPQMQKTLEDFAEGRGAEWETLLEEGGPTFANMSKDDVLMGMELELMQLLSRADPGAAAIEEMLKGESRLLARYFEELSGGAGKARGMKNWPTYDEFKAHFDQLYQEGVKTQAEKELAELATRQGISQEAVEEILEVGSRRPVEEAGEALAGKVKVSEIFPDYKNELFIRYTEGIAAEEQAIKNVLDRSDYADITTKEIAKYIGKPLRELLTGNNREPIIRTFDAYKVAKDLRTAIPMRPDGRSTIQQLIEISPQGYREGGKFGFIPKEPFTLPQIIDLRLDFKAMMGAFPQREIRGLSDEVIEGLDRLIADMMDKGYTKATGKTALPSNISARRAEFGQDLMEAMDNLAIKREELDAKYTIDLLNKSPDEIGQFLLQSSPMKISQLIKFINEMGLEGIDKLQATRELVLDAIGRSVRNPDKAAQNKAFVNLINKKEDQLAAIFPEEKLQQFKNYDAFATAANRSIRATEARINRLYTVMEENKIKSPPAFIQRFLNASADAKVTLRETPFFEELKELSKLADEFPELRQGMQGAFNAWMRKRIGGRDYAELSPGVRMRTVGREGGFNLNRLIELSLEPYDKLATRQGTEEFTRDLALILGKEKAATIAPNLRGLATRVDRLNRRNWMATADAASGGEAAAMLETMMRLIHDPQKWIFGQITKGSRRISLAASKIGLRTKRQMLGILSDDKKLAALVKVLDRQVNARDAIRILGTIYYTEGEQVGGDIRRDMTFDEKFGAKKLETLKSWVSPEEQERAGTRVMPGVP